MKTAITIMAMLVLAAGPLYGVAQPLPPSQEQTAPPPTPAQEQPEVLTRGPVHEAFAEPVNLQVQEGLVAPFQPPPNISEAPPTQSPQDGHYVWVPGYWSWDADRNNYIWVSACWRAAPPNMYWVPGYWAQVAEGWEWVAGFWSPMGTREIEYLPAAAGHPGHSAADSAVSGQHLGAALLVLVPESIYSKAGLLADGAARLALGAVSLRLDAAGLCLRRGPLGLHTRTPWHIVCAGLFPPVCLCPCGIFLFAKHSHRHRHAEHQSVHLSAIQPLLLRRLLR